MAPPPFSGGVSLSKTEPAPPPPPPSGNINYTDSVNSSPQSTGGGKLRLMCSYGGYIYPRPHDKCLSYVSGETRIFVADRDTSLVDLSTKLSKTFLAGKPFWLKYQLQNEDLDNLISVTSDEDLENMIDEYDRINNNSNLSSKVSRLRLFLFPVNPIKSEDWFVNVLKSKTSSTNLFSESSSVKCLLGLDYGIGNPNFKKHEVQSVPDSPMVETMSSSFGSASSLPSLAPIRVHVEENQKRNMSLSSPPELAAVAPEATVVSGVPVVAAGEYANRVLSDDDRKPTIQQPKPAIPSDLPSPDSVSSEGSVTNPLSRQRHYFYQERGVQIQSGSSRISSNSSADLKTIDSSGRAFPVQHDRHPQMLQPQQYVHAGQYIPPGAVPMSSYYSVYPSQHQTHPQHPGLEHQYPVYFIPAGPAQGYSLPLQQANTTEPAQTVPSSHPQTPLHPTMVTPTASYNPPASKPEMVAGTYRTAAAAPQFAQVTSGQHQQQYAAYSQIQHSSIPPTSATTANYAYDFADPTHAKMYYSQPLASQLSAQYQIMTSAPSVSFPETSSQLTIENLKQQIRTSQS